MEEYARWCNTVEGNTPLYAVPSERTVARWVEQAPVDFRFAFKVPRNITHELRLRREEVIGALAEFLDAIEPSTVARRAAPSTASCRTPEWDAS